jgi:AcrR family transcriptional regulator
MPIGILGIVGSMTMAASEGLRERKKRKTQKALQAAAIRLMSAKGFAGTTIEEIADAAEVSPRTFFRYFPTKEAVLLTDLQDETVAAYLAQASDDLSIIDTYEAALTAVFEDLTPEEWAVEQARAQLVASTPELRTTVGLMSALRPLDDAREFIARRLKAPPGDPRPRVYAAMLVAAAGAAVAPLFALAADTPLDRATFLDAITVGLELLKKGFPTGVDLPPSR